MRSEILNRKPLEKARERSFSRGITRMKKKNPGVIVSETCPHFPAVKCPPYL